eukprot:TRINITY_DN105061_c0_g1_i4.p1 TRINITY_DN105061_c0_g1~~TRINITY_DN105061_c0_g1_i4.p1  ORF type:complete len:131 (-),score=22.87 TRINITY_DN105061_c0_g1_i4:138-530(-)
MLRILQISCLNTFLVYQKTIDRRKDVLSFQQDAIHTLLSTGKSILAEVEETQPSLRILLPMCLLLLHLPGNGDRKSAECVRKATTEQIIQSCVNTAQTNLDSTCTRVSRGITQSRTSETRCSGWDVLCAY